ncbi:MAG: BatA domain-containing protein [Planctomycetaceae bacterium]|nr:BatA domain-containing protein [Planctomycetaceae bacterium]
MSFLSLAFLFALPLALAPVLLHLFDRRRNVVIEWGAMQFLQEAATQRTSARKLKQWLLLLLRVLAVAALIFAMARPLLQGSWFGREELGETVLVLDNSLSMLRKNGESTQCQAAVDRALAVVDELPQGEYVRVLLSSPYPIWVTAGSVRIDDISRTSVADQLKELSASQGTSDLLSSLFTAVQAELQPLQQQRRVILLTDGQAHDWSLEEEQSWQRFQQVLTDAPVPTSLKIIEVSESNGTGENLSVASLTSNRMTVGPGQPFQLTAQIQNFGTETTSPTSVVWSVDGDELHSSHVPDLDSGGVHDVVWKYSLSDPGVYSLKCSLDAEDDLPADNVSEFVIEVVEQMPVLLVEGSPELADLQRDAFFVEAALGWVDGERKIERGVYLPTVVTPDRLSFLDLSEFQAIVIPNLTSLEQEAVDRLQDFVSGGGGLWLAMGPRTDIDTFNERLFADGNGLAPLGLDRIVDEAPGDDEQPETKMNPFVSEHPATRQLTDTDQLDLGEVTVSRRFRFIPAPPGEEASVLLSLTNGEPVAVENVFGRGRVVVQALPLRMQWSGLARSQSFVVMVHDWMDYLMEPLATRYNLQPGEPLAVRLADSETRSATLQTPQGDTVELTADNTTGGVLFRSKRTVVPGQYLLETGVSGDAIPFVVERSTEESQLTSLSVDERKQLETSTTPLLAEGNRAAVSTAQQEPLWPLLLMILIVIIAGELILSGMISRERFGSDPIAETSQNWTEASSSPWGAMTRDDLEATASVTASRRQESTTVANSGVT